MIVKFGTVKITGEEKYFVQFNIDNAIFKLREHHTKDAAIKECKKLVKSFSKLPNSETTFL